MANEVITYSGVAEVLSPGAVQEIAVPKCSGAPRIWPKGRGTRLGHAVSAVTTSVARIWQWEGGLRMTSHLIIRCIQERIQKVLVGYMQL